MPADGAEPQPYREVYPRQWAFVRVRSCVGARDQGRSLLVTPRIDAVPARPIVEDVRPRVDDGHFASKSVVGDAVRVEADVFADGHDLLRVEVHHRAAGKRGWTREAMSPIGNDRWCGAFTPTQLGGHEFFVKGRVDHFGTWLRDLSARIAAGQDVALEALVGA
jgi:starch synthase (maltosyl-transferring)